MDQSPAAEPVDLGRGLSNTVAVLRAKARAKSAAVSVEVEPGLPPSRGYVGELNQVWANLIDNALDAIPSLGPGRRARGPRAARACVVRIVDNGAGMPEEVREPASSIRSSPPSLSARAPASASTSRGA